ncbi:hypothetical protein [Pseudorhodoferax sp.]
MPTIIAAVATEVSGLIGRIPGKDRSGTSVSSAWMMGIAFCVSAT